MLERAGKIMMVLSISLFLATHPFEYLEDLYWTVLVQWPVRLGYL
jgi:hypothetical protein